MPTPTVTFDELYDNEAHVCCPLIYEPAECPPCARCNHGSDCAHPDGHYCQAVGCNCTRALVDGDCPDCNGEGWVENGSGRTFTCRARACVGGRVA